MLFKWFPQCLLILQGVTLADFLPSLERNEAEAGINLDREKSFGRKTRESIHNPRSENGKRNPGTTQVNEPGTCCICLGAMPVSEVYSREIKIGNLNVESQEHHPKKNEKFLKYLRDKELHVTSTCGHITHLNCVGSWMKNGGKFCAICKLRYVRQDVPPGGEFDEIRNSFPVGHSNDRNEVTINIPGVENSRRAPFRNYESSSIIIYPSEGLQNCTRHAVVLITLMSFFIGSLVLFQKVDEYFSVVSFMSGISIIVYVLYLLAFLVQR